MPGARPATSKQPKGGGTPPEQRRMSTIKLVVISVLVTIGMLGWWFWKNPPADPNATPSPSASASAKPNIFGPAVVEPSRITGLPAELGHPVYWAGLQPETSHQLVIAADGAVGLRYLNPANDDPEQGALTVATQKNPEAYKVAKESYKWLFPTAKASPGAADPKPSPSASSLRRAQVNPDGSLVFLDGASTSVGHLVRADLPYLITVFSPEPGQTWQLLSSGAIAPIPN